MVILGYAGTVLSVVGLIILFTTWRKPARIRNWIDAVRVGITAAVIAGMMVLLGVTTSIWLAGAAVTLGLLLGAGQGFGLHVQLTEKGLMAPVKRDVRTRARTESCHSIRIPEIAREMTSCWICSVPSKMSWVLPGCLRRDAQFL